MAPSAFTKHEVQPETVAIIGGGLIGALSACVFAQRGYDVHLFEYRQDLRLLKESNGRSVNLTISTRGIAALKRIGLENFLEESTVPMNGRCIHSLNGNQRRVLYGFKGETYYTLRRRHLNESLLTACEKYPNVHLHFEHKLTDIDVDTAKLTLQRPSGEVLYVQPDFVIGCDGAYSKVRSSLAKKLWFDFSQNYISHGYIEIPIPATSNGDFALDPSFFHVWPRGKFMLTALPNTDGTFTANLFMEKEMYESLSLESDIVNFFEANFPDALDLIGRRNLFKTFSTARPWAFISIKCSSYHWLDKCIIIGDAAHAMVPFYAQGMNCGMEDVLVLDEMMDLYPRDRSAAFENYTKKRRPDAHAICDLAMYNYTELRDLVTKPSFQLRQKLDRFLYWLLPDQWVPLYNSVVFTRMRYHHCVEKKKRQDKIINFILGLFCFVIGFIVVVLIFQTL